MIKVGVSHCLLGEKVRYDGGHKRSEFCVNHLTNVFQFVPLCPEVGIGLSVPRPTIHLKGRAESPRAVMTKDESQDFTAALKTFADQNTRRLAQMSGYIFCPKSPSCGLERVKVFQDNGQPIHTGTGIFAARVKALFPLLPLEEDGRLNDAGIRDSFIKRVYLYHEWQNLVAQGLTLDKLFKFHARHKMLLLAHCQSTYRQLGRFISQTDNLSLADACQEYIQALMQAIKIPATRGNNTNVLMHLQGYLKEYLTSEDRQELANCILEYQQGTQPILSPLTLLKHHFKNFPDPYISRQSYLDPYPKELAIRVITK